jgi:hypothetical protein
MAVVHSHFIIAQVETIGEDGLSFRHPGMEERTFSSVMELFFPKGGLYIPGLAFEAAADGGNKDSEPSRSSTPFRYRVVFTGLSAEQRQRLRKLLRACKKGGVPRSVR